MSARPELPTLSTGVGAVFRLQWMRMVRGKRLRLGVVAVALVVIAVTAARYAASGVEPVDVMQEGTRLGFFTLLVYLVPFLLTSGAIAEEVESRTFTFLATRPVGRTAITLGKYAAGVAMALALVVGGLVLMHLLVYLTEPSSMVDELTATLKAGGALALLVLLYGAICIFWGAVATEAAGIVSALYLGVVEFGFGMLPGVFRFPSMNYLATQLAGLPKGGLLSHLTPDIESWIPVAAIVPMTLVFLGFAVLTVKVSEYRFGKA